MYSDADQQKVAELKKILMELATSEGLLQEGNGQKKAEFYGRLERLYYNKDPEQRFRHLYSDIFATLTEIKKHPEKSNVNVLAANVRTLWQDYQPINRDEDGNLIDINKSLKKLFDHVNLDVARMDYSDYGDREITKQDAIDQLKSRVDALDPEVKESQGKLNEVNSKMERAEKEYISILGIFASIVLAFVAGISFSTSILGAINQASAYRLIVLALVIGIVLVNTLYALFHYIERIVYSGRSEQENDQDAVGGTENKTRKKHMGRLESVKPLIISNAIFIALIALVIIAWYMGLIECRNARM